MADKNYEKELKKLQKLFENIPENKRKLVESLIQNCAFMKVTLDKIQLDIIEQGATDTWKNSENSFGAKASASLSAYNSLLKNYVPCIKTLNSMLPEDGRLSKDDMEDLLS